MSVGVMAPESVQIQDKAKNNRIPKGVRIILYIILTMLMTLTILLLTAVISVKTIVTKDNIHNIIKNTDYLTIKVEDPDGYELTLYEMMCSQFKTSHLKIDSFYKLIEDTGVEEKLAEYVYNYAAFVLYDETLDEINAKTIINLYEKNIDKIESALGVTLTESNKSTTEEQIKNQRKIFDMLSEYEIKETLGVGLGIIRFFFSVPGIIVLSVAAAVFLALIIIVSKSVSMPVCITGSVFSVIGLAGLTTLILAVTGNFIVDISKLSVASIVYQSAAGVLAPIMIKFMGYILSVGIILILAASIINTIIKKRHRA